MENSDVAVKRHEAANWIRVINKIKPSACSTSLILLPRMPGMLSSPTLKNSALRKSMKAR